MNSRSAISKINKNGILLVFPVNNKKEPNSLWQELYPKKKLRWEWDDSGDNKVFDMWSLMKRLSESGQVVYSKWYQGRATFISKDLFTSVLKLSAQNLVEPAGLSHAAKNILEVLESDSPLSTKQLKKICELQGKDNSRIYDKAMRELFNRFLIVAYGEVDDGAFPSLAVGATRTIFEDLWLESQEISLDRAQKNLEKYMPQGSLTRRFYEKNRLVI